MIIKVVRGSFFGGVIDYVTRRGKHASQADARVLEAPGLFDHRTFAAQLSYDAARDPKRTRPVVHLIARAERSLTDAQYAELGDRMLQVAGLAGRAHIKVVHDEPDDHEDHGHLHLVVCEVDDEGKAPARLWWDKINRREVTAEAARALPKRSVESRAWDSQLAWKLTALARELEIAWGLRQLSSKKSIGNPDEPETSRAQQEQLARTGMAPLQDRFFHEVRSALALPTWDERAAALAAHGLVLRPYEAKARVRGLMVQSINNGKDAVKVSAFNLGGMGKLDASADMPFLTWHPQYKAAINLRKTTVESRNNEWRATQRQFRLHLQDWQAVQKRRKLVHDQHSRDRAKVIDDFAKRLADEPCKILRRDIRAQRSEQLVLIKASREFALLEAGPKAPRPTFANFVEKRAREGDAAAAQVHRDLLSKVSQTRREALNEHKAQIAKLAAAAKSLRIDAARLRARLAGLAADLRGSIDPARKRAVRIQTLALDRSRVTAAMLAQKASDLAKRLVEQFDRGGYRIRVVPGQVSVDRFQPDREQLGLMSNPAHLPIFRSAAEGQKGAIRSLRLAIREAAALTVRDGRPEINVAALPSVVHKHLRWHAEPEVQEVLADLHKRHERETARGHAARQKLQAEKERSMADPLSAHRRQRPEANTPGDSVRSKLIAAAQTRDDDSRATKIYLLAWQSALQALPNNQVISSRHIRAIEIGAVDQLLNDHAGFGEHIIKQLIAGRSPAMAIAKPDGNWYRWANTVFNAAVQRPDIKQKVEQNRLRAAEAAQMQDQRQIIDKMEQTVRKGSKSDDLWTELYEQLLSERPVDLTLDRDKLYGACDLDVSAKLLREGLPLADVRGSLKRLSPLSPISSGMGKGSGLKAVSEASLRRSFQHYVDATLAKAVDTLPLVEQKKRQAEARVWRQNMRQIRSVWSGLEEDIEGRTMSDAVPMALPELPRSANTLEGRQVEMLELAPVAASGAQDIAHLFGPDGQPQEPLRGMLDEVRENHADYVVGADGRLTAPGWTENEQKNLQVVQQHAIIRDLMLKAFAQAADRRNPARRIIPRDGLER